MRLCRPSCRLKETGGKNCRLVRGILYKSSLYQVIKFNNRLCPEIDKNVENLFQCFFAAFFPKNLRYPFFTQLDGDRERRGLPDAAAGKEIVDFPGELPMITHSPVATMDMRYEP